MPTYGWDSVNFIIEHFVSFYKSFFLVASQLHPNPNRTTAGYTYRIVPINPQTIILTMHYQQLRMSGEPEVTHTPEGEEEEEIKTSYKPPPEKTIEEILAADQEDESLRKYKEALLGQAQTGTVIVGTYFNS